MSDTQVDADSTAYTVLFEDDAATDTSFTGGKGANLARPSRRTFPSGFCVTTAAYRAVIDDSDIQTAIRLLETLDPADTETIAEASAEIRSKIRQRELPDAVQHAVVDALNWFTADAYSVRSSATAEDLPTASFAGQHETFLGITEQAAVLDRIRDCMASLFTDRAVSYRSRNDISHTEADMAVVVQAMVDPEVAGVLFTADPCVRYRTLRRLTRISGLEIRSSQVRSHRQRPHRSENWRDTRVRCREQRPRTSLGSGRCWRNGNSRTPTRKTGVACAVGYTVAPPLATRSRSYWVTHKTSSGRS